MSGAVETGSGRGRTVTLPARPEPIRVSVEETAIVVIDMQNAYASKGGYVDLAGFDISGAAGTIGQIAKVLATGRAAGVTIVYLQNGWDADYIEAGGPGSPNWHKSSTRPATAPSSIRSWIPRSAPAASATSSSSASPPMSASSPRSGTASTSNISG
jgi:nicotinamidase-related amidase